MAQYGRKHFYKEDIFEIINNEEKAYWLGFLFADGNVQYKDEINKPKRYAIELTLSEKDKPHLRKFEKFINCENIIKEKTVKYKDKVYKAVRIYLSSKRMCDDLINKGCIPKKSSIKKMPKLDEDLITHFWRGYFDGNGSIWFTKTGNLNIELHSSLDMITSFKDYFKISTSIDKPSGCYRIRKSGEEALNILDKMYKNHSICLDRKYSLIALLLRNQ